MIKVFSFKWNTQLKEVIQPSVLKQRLDSHGQGGCRGLQSQAGLETMGVLPIKLLCHSSPPLSADCGPEMQTFFLPAGRNRRPQTLGKPGSLLSSWALSRERKCRFSWVLHWPSAPQGREAMEAWGRVWVSHLWPP